MKKISLSVDKNGNYNFHAFDVWRIAHALNELIERYRTELDSCKMHAGSTTPEPHPDIEEAVKQARIKERARIVEGVKKIISQYCIYCTDGPHNAIDHSVECAALQKVLILLK